MAWKSADGAYTIQHPDRFLIGGEWVAPSTDRTIRHLNPATEDLEIEVAEAVEADIDRAVAAARDAFDSGPWPRMSPAERAGYLRKLADGIRRLSPQLGHSWTREVGVLYALSEHGGTAFAGYVDQHAGWADTFPWEQTFPTTDGLGGDALVVQEPVGVVGAIIPWNAAFVLALVKLTPALLAGCTVVLKASPEAPIGPYLIADLIHSLGLPPGVFNFLTADREASERLVRNPDVDKITFTGSTAAGKRIASICGERIARYTLELGGKSAALVLDDYDIEAAATTLANSTAYMTNQVCAALSRVVVSDDRHDQMVDALARRFEAIKVGDPYAADSQMGPLAMGRQLERVQGYIEIGKKEASLVTGGGRPADLNRGYYVEPTLFADVNPDSRIAQEEIFGPVVVVIRAKDQDDAIRIANNSSYGLDGAVFTQDPKLAYRVARQIRTGTIGHNLHRMDFGVSFGGFKQSGIGREGGQDGLRSFLESKAIMLQPHA
ncbi:aldehyde dehydrogenase [Sphingosinicella microcystinivorans]|uniref:aldehyde dehydrogenase n=1 Tax=Sphingosinicella microcystinivorans TaxID=335406 RepID=UPI0022F3FD0D|nr:aldehyde dehydrogenase [Sphingosinicella microcystinivorans]WBX86194.1 aldehyde dehydrogenase [Sphingosinicella microcystinivorans]